MKAVNPYTRETIREYGEHSKADVEERLASAARAFDGWSETPMNGRSSRMKDAAGVLLKRKDELARLMTAEMGKPIEQSEAEIEKCAWVCEHYAGHAAGYLEQEDIETDAGRSYVRFDPLGPVLAVMPWNFPFWQVFRFAAPTLMAGNAGLLKHASNVPGCALAIEEVFREAGFPDGVFQTLMIGSDAVPGVIRDGRVRAVTLTGSEKAGQAVAEEAGRNLKKAVLELGGSDPFIVLADAPVAETAASAADARLLNSGQSCIAAKRFFVEDAVHDEFVEAFTSEMRSRKLGDPMERDTEVGPLAREDLAGELHRQVEESVARRARVLAGGRPAPDFGFAYEPTVLAEVAPGMPAFDEETFGPVAAVIRTRGEDEAVELANRSIYGLGASIWTADVERAQRLAGRIEAGHVAVNEMVKSDPRLPFGGVKRSGYGRELGEFGIREFVNIKTVVVK